MKQGRKLKKSWRNFKITTTDQSIKDYAAVRKGKKKEKI